MFNWLKNERCAEIELLGLFPAYVGVREFAEATEVYWLGVVPK